MSVNLSIQRSAKKVVEELRLANGNECSGDAGMRTVSLKAMPKFHHGVILKRVVVGEESHPSGSRQAGRRKCVVSRPSHMHGEHHTQEGIGMAEARCLKYST